MGAGSGDKSRLGYEQLGKKLEVAPGLACGFKRGAGEVAGGIALGGAERGVGQQAGEGGGEGAVVAGADDVAADAVAQAFADAAGVEGDGGETVGLGLDEEVGKGFGLGGEDGDVGGGVERAGVGLEAEETHAVGEAESGGEGFAIGAGGAFAGEPELPVGGAVQGGGDADEGALVFFGAEHAHAEQHAGGGAGAVAGAQRVVAVVARGGRENQGVVDDGDFRGGQAVAALKQGGGFGAVGDDVGDGAERAPEEPRERFAGAQGAEDDGARQGAGEAADRLADDLTYSAS